MEKKDKKTTLHLLYLHVHVAETFTGKSSRLKKFRPPQPTMKIKEKKYFL